VDQDEYKTFDQSIESRVVSDEIPGAQSNTQIYGKRPYGVGFLVIGKDVSFPSSRYLAVQHRADDGVITGNWTTPVRVLSCRIGLRVPRTRHRSKESECEDLS
jgi:hypothetical protein